MTPTQDHGSPMMTVPPTHGTPFAPLAMLATLTTVLGLLAAAPASAQTITQNQQFLGWTATGNEVVSRVTVGAKGLNDAGDPVDWRYTVIEIANARTGKVLNTYRSGEPVGPPQDAFNKAKSESDGQKILKSLGLIAGVPGNANPATTMAVVSFTSNADGDSVITDTCPGCSTCETTLRVVLVAQSDQKVYTVRERTTTGAPYPPGDSMRDCPELNATTWWHPQGDRFAIVLTDHLRSSGTVLETLTVYTPEDNAAAWPSVDIPENSGAARTRQVLEELQAHKAKLAEIPDPAGKAHLLTQLGDLAGDLGQHDAARGYYESAQQFDKGNLHAQLGVARGLLQQGRSKDALKLVGKLERLDRKAGALTAELGLFYLIAGDTKSAATMLQRSVDKSGADYADRLQLGLRILDANLESGIAYMDNLLGAVPENPDAALTTMLSAAYVRMAREAITIRDYPTAIRYVGRLDKQSGEARELALELTALSATDSTKARLALDKSDALLKDDPSQCRLYFVRAMAFRQLVKPDQVLANLSASVACDPSLTESHYYLGDLLAAAGDLPGSRTHFTRFLELAGDRLGDRARTLRRAHAQSLLPRLAFDGVVLLSSECDLRSGKVICRGVLSNTSKANSGPVPIALTATSTGKRPKVTGEGHSELPDVAAGATVDFSISIAQPADTDALELTLGRNDDERTVNKTAVEVF